jgi:hypothetical protein
VEREVWLVIVGSIWSVQHWSCSGEVVSVFRSRFVSEHLSCVEKDCEFGSVWFV